MLSASQGWIPKRLLKSHTHTHAPVLVHTRTHTHICTQTHICTHTYLQMHGCECIRLSLCIDLPLCTALFFVTERMSHLGVTWELGLLLSNSHSTALDFLFLFLGFFPIYFYKIFITPYPSHPGKPRAVIPTYH